MSSLYVLDGHTTPLVATPILDVLYGGMTPTPFPGGFIVKVDDDLRVTNPTDLYTPVTGLIPQKYTSMLATHPGFSRIVFDDMLDALNINAAAASYGGQYGERGTNRLQTGQEMISTSYTLATTPAQVVVKWECFKVSYVRDPASPTERWTQTYEVLPSSAVTVKVLFNGGIGWVDASEGGLLTIPPTLQGTQLKVWMTAATDCYLGGWAVIY